jgi:hypothetical protein
MYARVRPALFTLALVVLFLALCNRSQTQRSAHLGTGTLKGVKLLDELSIGQTGRPKVFYAGGLAKPSDLL